MPSSISRNGRARGIGDCLIRARAKRLKHEVVTSDSVVHVEGGRTDMWLIPTKAIPAVMLSFVAALGLADEPAFLAQQPAKVTIAYVRVLGKSASPECTFTIERIDKGWTIHSVTERGN